MSASAIARRRAAAASAPPPPSFLQQQQMPSPPPPPTNNRMLTLQEVIALVDSRLTNLEFASQQQRMFQQQQQQQSPQITGENSNSSDLESMISSMLEPHLEEFNHRYEILATEILNIKNVVMKLQSYTLDVNKMLVDERIRVLADPLLEGTVSSPPPTDAKEEEEAGGGGKEEDEAVQTPTNDDDDAAVVTYTLEEDAIIEEEIVVAPTPLSIETPAKKPRKKRNVLSI